MVSRRHGRLERVGAGGTSVVSAKYRYLPVLLSTDSLAKWLVFKTLRREAGQLTKR